jgi:hypothetical protein
MNLHTGKKIHGYRFTELAMPQHIIDTVHDLADAEDAPDLDEDGCPFFEWELGAPVNAEDEAIPPIPPIHAAPDDESDGGDSTDDNNDDGGIVPMTIMMMIMMRTIMPTTMHPSDLTAIMKSVTTMNHSPTTTSLTIMNPSQMTQHQTHS